MTIKYTTITDPVQLFQLHKEGKKIEANNCICDEWATWTGDTWHATRKFRFVEEIPDPVWPQEGDKCWILSSSGNTSEINYHHVLKSISDQGNLFRTKEDAIAERDTRTTITKFQCQPGARKFIPERLNHGIHFEGCEVVRSYWASTSASFASAYFGDSGQLEAAIVNVGEDRILAAMKWRELGEC